MPYLVSAYLMELKAVCRTEREEPPKTAGGENTGDKW